MNGNKYKKYFPKVKANKKNFEYLIDCIKEANDYDDKIRLANYALRYATYHNTGYFISSFLENFYTDFAQRLDLENYKIEYTPNSFLHVITRGYQKGGHTRVVERWIENAPNSQKHSVIFTTPNQEDMSLLEKLTAEKNGECIYLNTSWRLNERALKLRRIGMEYQYVVLHTHMDDPIATIAFGTEKFTRPVIFYNHASHLFWLGKNIADLVLDIESDDYVTKKLKGIQNSFPIGIPCKDIIFSKSNKVEFKKKLNLPQGKKIIVSSGNEYKYLSICDDNFYNILSQIIDEETYCYIIGLSMKEWGHVYERSDKHIVPLGYINFNDGYLDYLKAADLYLDSYPLCSATATIDAVAVGTPVLSLKSVYPPLDYLSETTSYCVELRDYVEKAKRILNDKKYAKAQLKELQESLNRYQSKEVWTQNVQKMLELVPSKHSVKLSDENDEINEINDLAVFTNVVQDRNFFNDNPVEKFNIETIKKILTPPPISTKVSVIVYVYNAEKYLNDCIESLCSQTLNDIEIIVVDDCSEDKSLTAIEKETAKDNRIRIIKFSEHKGKHAARDFALDYVKGMYVMFINAEDFYEPCACEDAYNQIVRNNSELCLFSFYNYSQNSGKKALNTGFDEIKKHKANISDEYYIFKREFLNVNNIRFAKEKSEGTEFLSKAYKLAKAFCQTDMPLYNKRILEEN